MAEEKGSFGEMVVLFELKKIKKKSKLVREKLVNLVSIKVGQYLIHLSIFILDALLLLNMMETNPPKDRYRMNRTWGKLEIWGGGA